MKCVHEETFDDAEVEDSISPLTFIKIAEEALGTGDTSTAARFIEMAYQAFDALPDDCWEADLLVPPERDVI